MAALGAKQLCDERVYPCPVVQTGSVIFLTCCLAEGSAVGALSLTVASVIASKTQESDYESVAKNVFQQVTEYNKILIDSLQNNKG